MNGTRESLARSLLESKFLPAEEFRSNLYVPPAEGLQGKPYGKFLVLRKVGEGGFSKVFLAIDPLLQRSVAIKVLKRPDAEDLARFRREAQVAAELHHPHIVPLYEIGQVGRETYLAMGYVDGAPPGPLDPAGAARIGAKIARALAVAHARGLVHRDVKPQNILVDAGGEPYLTDFGLAKHVDQEGFKFLSQTGSVMGTPCYMSPEQARGETRTVGPATDVYALGATLYYLSTGRIPFDGATALEIIRKVVETRPPSPRSVNPEVPRALDAIIRKAMAPEPGDRYPEGGALADDLERFLNGQFVSAGRGRFGVGVAAAACVASLALAALLWPATAEKAPPPAPPPVATTSPATTEPPAPKKDPVPIKPAPAPEPETPVPPPPKPEPEKPKPPPGVPIDPALKARIRARVLDAPLGLYLKTEERRRLRALLDAERALPEDLRFLIGRIDGEVADQIEADRRFLATAIASRESKAMTVSTPDVIRFKDGRIHEGRVLEDKGGELRYSYKKQSITVPRSMVASVSREESAEARFVKRLKAVSPARELEDLAKLAEWCRGNKLGVQREFVLYRMLRADPANGPARSELGLPAAGPLRPPAADRPGADRTPRPFAYEGKRYSREELRKELLKRGFIIVNGRWCAARKWTWSAPRYWKNKVFAVGGENVAVRTWNEVTSVRKFDIDRGEIVTIPRPVPKFWYVGPVAKDAPAEGVARIRIDAPGGILDGKIRTVSSILDGGGSIELSVEAGAGKPAPLATLSSGTDRTFRDLPPSVRGARSFTLVARIRTRPGADPSGRPHGGAFFLKGTDAEPEPLSVEGRIAEPVDELNTLLPPE